MLYIGRLSSSVTLRRIVAFAGCIASFITIGGLFFPTMLDMFEIKVQEIDSEKIKIHDADIIEQEKNREPIRLFLHESARICDELVYAEAFFLMDPIVRIGLSNHESSAINIRAGERVLINNNCFLYLMQIRKLDRSQRKYAEIYEQKE